MKRNDEELRVESSGYHGRQPYAVMIAIMMLPYDSLTDGQDISSFGAFVQYLRPLAGRRDPGDDIALFERVFMCIYDLDGAGMEFFDVQQQPRKKGRPDGLLTYEDFLKEVKGEYDRRNHSDAEFKWANGYPRPPGE